MAKKQKENYTPQFDFDNIEEIKLETQTCKGCGKTGTHLGLNKDGLCFECSRKSLPQNPSKTPESFKPNNDLYFEYKGKKRSYMVGLMPGLIWHPLHKYGAGIFFIVTGLAFLLNIADTISFFIALIFITIGIYLLCTLKRRTLKKFHKYNSETVSIIENEWKCPCCKNYNYGYSYCKTCGVRPILKELNKVKDNF
ncbi:MAG: hypothetical protein Q4B40_02800 [Clostridia bacterium]|nr:hypothetical protein [Clostridia bacterium]